MKTTQENGNRAAATSAEVRQLIDFYNQGRLDDAIEYGGALSGKYPRDPSLHNMLGVINARLGRLELALHHYDNALSIRIDYAEVHNNRGNTLSRLARSEEAIGSFSAALKANPAYVEAHNNLGSAFHDTGRIDEAISSYSEALRLKPDYAEAHNNLGNALMDAGRPEDALTSFRHALRHNSNLVQAYNNIGNVLRTLGRYDEAVENFSRATQIWPDYVQAYSGLGNALNDQGRHREAIVAIKKALLLNPDWATAHNDLANVLSDLGRNDEAVESYKRALDIDPSFAEVFSNLGNTLCELGQYEDAIASYEQALRLKPEFAEAHNNLSKNKRFSADDRQIADMLIRLKEPDISDHELMYLSFALGKAFEDIDEIDRSFEFLSQGNRLRKTELQYDIQIDTDQFELIKRLFTPENRPTPLSDISTDSIGKNPIFVVGLPRSGTTLTEQILASHSKVFGAGELRVVGRILSPTLRKLAATGTWRIPTDGLRELRKTYLHELSEIGDESPYVTDKMPANFKWVGCLLTAMPGVKIINLNRDPAASCWSMYKLLFSGNGYTNDLADLGKYFQLYSDLMDFWRQEFPDQIYDLNYESLTENQERETRMLLEYCELPWEDRCLEFHKTKRSVATHSGKQVREKMYTGSSLAWRKYEKHLEPLLEILNETNQAEQI